MSFGMPGQRFLPGRIYFALFDWPDLHF